MNTSIDEIFPSSVSARGEGHRTEGGNGPFHSIFNDFSHVADPNLRRRLALSEIDRVSFGRYRMLKNERLDSSACFSSDHRVMLSRVD